jgi:hypothetical protein
VSPRLLLLPPILGARGFKRSDWGFPQNPNSGTRMKEEGSIRRRNGSQI